MTVSEYKELLRTKTIFELKEQLSILNSQFKESIGNEDVISIATRMTFIEDELETRSLSQENPQNNNKN